ncbi:MAG: ribonuclease P protein component [Candidatus Puniceispirillales bacterium]
MPGTRTLLHRSDFLATARHGDKFVAASLIMQVRDRRDDEAPRLGLTATRKIGNAVIRNRARRRMRAAASQRLTPRARPGHDYVLIARHNTASRPWQGLVDDLDRLIADHEKQLQ